MTPGRDPSLATTPGRRWLADGLAGVSVALILVPQSMAYAELAGLPVHRGLFAAALPPLAAAFFASSPYLQTGPVALTSLLTFGALSTMATPESDEYVLLAALLAIIVGVVRFAVGLLRAGSVSYLLSQPVLRGFTTAAALLIFASQLPYALGSAAEGDGVIGRAFWALTHPNSWEPAALGLSALTLVLMIGGRKLHPMFPGVLLAVVMGIVFSMVSGYGGSVVGEIPPVLLPPFSLDLPWEAIPSLFVGGVIIALVGFAEAASVAQTFAEQTRRPWDPNKEFLSQGAANLASGIAGGFPVGGSFSRSALNKLAGAQTRWSGGITGITVLLFLPFAYLVTPLPRAILGAIVIGAIYALLKPGPLLVLWKQSRLQAMVGYATFVLTLLLAPHIEYAVVAGVVLALGVHGWRELNVKITEKREGPELVLRPIGVLWFGCAPILRQGIAGALVRHPEVQRLTVDLGGVGRIDLTGAEALADCVRSAAEGGTEVSIRGVPAHAERILGRVCPEFLVPMSGSAEEHVEAGDAQGENEQGKAVDDGIRTEGGS